MIYDCKCEKCEKVEEIVRSVAERNNTPLCCGQPMKRMITVNYNVYSDLNFMTEDITGSPVQITSRQQHDRLCRENNVSPMGLKGEF